MKFIHSSDWHIGRLFQNVSLLDDQLYVLAQLKKYIEDYKVDALLIAGDIFDRSVPPADAVAALDDFLAQLSLPIIMISGNHDSGKRLSFGAKKMQSAGWHILTDIKTVTTPVIIDSPEGEVHIYGIPYHDPVHVREAYGCDVKTYDQAHNYLVDLIKSVRVKGIPSIVMSHCFIAGGEPSDSERPLSIGGADQVSYQPLEEFDYVALGHLHAPQHKGAEHIRYSGSLLKYSFSEHAQQKSLTLVELGTQGLQSISQLELNAQRDVRIIEGKLDDLIQQGASDPNQHDYIFARLTDKHDLLDPMGQLRQVYPNILQLERLHFINQSASQLIADLSNERNEQQVFSDFFSQVIGQELTSEQTVLLAETINEAKTLIEGKQ